MENAEVAWHHSRPIFIRQREAAAKNPLD